MAKVVFEDTQRYHQPFAYGLIGLFTILAGYRLIQGSVQAQLDTAGVVLCISIIAFLLLSVWYLYQMRFTVRVSKKKIILRTAGPFSRKQKIALKNIKKIDFVRLSPGTMWSGWLVHLPSQFKSYDFGDKGALHIEMKDGEEYLIFSDKLYDQREELPPLQDLTPVP